MGPYQNWILITAFSLFLGLAAACSNGECRVCVIFFYLSFNEYMGLFFSLLLLDIYVHVVLVEIPYQTLFLMF